MVRGSYGLAGKKGRRLNWLVCALKSSELPLQHLIAILDGATLTINKWSGSIGKLLNDATALEINPSFKVSFPNWTSHGQSIERRVKQVTEAEFLTIKKGGGGL